MILNLAITFIVQYMSKALTSKLFLSFRPKTPQSINWWLIGLEARSIWNRDTSLCKIYLTLDHFFKNYVQTLKFFWNCTCKIGCNWCTRTPWFPFFAHYHTTRGNAFSSKTCNVLVTMLDCIVGCIGLLSGWFTQPPSGRTHRHAQLHNKREYWFFSIYSSFTLFTLRTTNY